MERASAWRLVATVVIDAFFFLFLDNPVPHLRLVKRLESQKHRTQHQPRHRRNDYWRDSS
jgi:hypothetical protein